MSTLPDGIQDHTPVITDWSAVSPYGIGRAAFRAGVLGGHRTAAATGPSKNEQACQVPDFTPGAALGKRGTRSMDRVTALAVATVGELLGPPLHRTEDDGGTASTPGTSLVLGTTTGSAQSMMDFTRSSFTGEQPFYVDPARFPNTVMNCAAGQSAIWYRLKGPNATIAGGRTAGLLALNYARRLQRAGRADTVLCGGAEEYSPARNLLQRHGWGDDEPDAVLGEGCALLRLEQPDAAPDGLAGVVALAFGVFGGFDEIEDVLSDCVRRALDTARATADEIWAVAPGDAAGESGRRERAALAGLLGAADPLWISCTELIGDTSAGAAAFQITALLAAAEGRPEAVGRLGLVTSVDRDGAVGCALLRFLPGPEGRDRA